MATYPANSDVTLTIPFQDAAGNTLTPTAISYTVIDELEDVIVPPTAVPVGASGASSFDLLVPAAANALQPPSTSYTDGEQTGVTIVSSTGLREVDVTFTTAAGSFTVPIRYFLSIARRLYVMQNSFQPYNQALLIANDMPNLLGWGMAGVTDDQRIDAMIEGWLRLTRLAYFVRWPLDPDAQNYINWGNTQNSQIIPRLWTVMSTDRWFTYYPEVFRGALRMAQIAEADQILLGDPIRQKRNQGIISEKIGESSFMFKSRKPLDLGVSAEALAYLKGYVDYGNRISRA